MPKRVDANQAEIVAGLRAAGCSVQDIHIVGKGCPDILAGRAGQNYLIEIKSARGYLNYAESDWHAGWQGQVDVARTLEEALVIVGLDPEEYAWLLRLEEES